MQPLLTRASFKASSLYGCDADESKTSFSSSFCFSLDDDPFHFHCPWKYSLFFFTWNKIPPSLSFICSTGITNDLVIYFCNFKK